MSILYIPIRSQEKNYTNKQNTKIEISNQKTITLAGKDIAKTKRFNAITVTVRQLT